MRRLIECIVAALAVLMIGALFPAAESEAADNGSQQGYDTSGIFNVDSPIIGIVANDGDDCRVELSPILPAVIHGDVIGGLPVDGMPPLSGAVGSAGSDVSVMDYVSTALRENLRTGDRSETYHDGVFRLLWRQQQPSTGPYCT